MSNIQALSQYARAALLSYVDLSGEPNPKSAIPIISAAKLQAHTQRGSSGGTGRKPETMGQSGPYPADIASASVANFASAGPGSPGRVASVGGPAASGVEKPLQ